MNAARRYIASQTSYIDRFLCFLFLICSLIDDKRCTIHPPSRSTTTNLLLTIQQFKVVAPLYVKQILPPSLESLKTVPLGTPLTTAAKQEDCSKLLCHSKKCKEALYGIALANHGAYSLQCSTNSPIYTKLKNHTSLKNHQLHHSELSLRHTIGKNIQNQSNSTSYVRQCLQLSLTFTSLPKHMSYKPSKLTPKQVSQKLPNIMYPHTTHQTLLITEMTLQHPPANYLYHTPAPPRISIQQSKFHTQTSIMSLAQYMSKNTLLTNLSDHLPWIICMYPEYTLKSKEHASTHMHTTHNTFHIAIQKTTHTIKKCNCILATEEPFIIKIHYNNQHFIAKYPSITPSPLQNKN